MLKPILKCRMTWSSVLITLICLARVASGSGIGASNRSEVCSTTEKELQALLIDDTQLHEGIEGNQVAETECKYILETGILRHRTDEEQAALCDLDCFATLATKYKTLLDNDCYVGEDEDARASASLQAASFQIACQTTIEGKYCIQKLANLVLSAGDTIDLCSDVVSGLGCCFQSYRQYMMYGTEASKEEMNKAQQLCIEDGVDDIQDVCPCGEGNMFNIHATKDSKICSASVAQSLSLAVTTLVTLASLLLF